ncbi:hypothetical protein FK514_30930 [Klebsiella pneumoniae]|uniref:hypothetical protein n=1 Tax=Klebsiella pneumoniae TaxID=573 RepID=UPI00210DCFAA|nr:hypothetical protein [Klebsiella pneumoniae]MCQ4052154.1 hypothetical protein [Klebsiella pneumoniae]
MSDHGVDAVKKRDYFYVAMFLAWMVVGTAVLFGFSPSPQTVAFSVAMAWAALASHNLSHNQDP